MTIRSNFRLLIALVATQSTVGCSRFVWHEDPFTPDPAPTTEIIASPGDTTYVLHGASYYLLAQQRNTLWNREVMDDVAWRYRALFGEAPIPIAVRIDTVATIQDSATTWRGMPLVAVALRRRRDTADTTAKAERDQERQAADDLVHARLVAGPILAATAADAWLAARALEAIRGSDSQPGGPERPADGAVALPAWIQAGALRILGSAGAPDRAAAELRAGPKGVVPLASLFAVAWQRRPNAAAIVRSGAGRFDLDDAEIRASTAARVRGLREATGGVLPLFIAQSVSVLAFIHERDPALVARLADELTRGASVSSVLASCATLPHDVAGLDAEWRKWLQRSSRRR